MYPPPPPGRVSQMNAREFVDRLDELITEKILNMGPMHVPCKDRVEQLKREMTDYLLATDPRKGIYAKGPND